MKFQKKFLMIYPEIPHTYWSYHYALGIIGKRAVMPPLGLATIAAMVPPEYDCKIVDMNVARLTDHEIASADLVLISAMIVQGESMKRVIGRCRRIGVPVAAGGPYPTACSDEIEGVDYLILGEGEVTFTRFLEDYAAGSPQPVYSAESKPDMNCTPIPRFDLLELNKYHMVPIQFSRGCPFDCEFCDIVQLFGHTVRTKKPERFVAEMEAAYRTGFTGAMFVVDDNFIGNHRRTKELLRSVIAWQREHNYPFTLSTEASIDLAYDRELLDLMVEASFGMVFVGLETPDDNSLAAAGKQQNRKRDVIESVRTIQRSGIEVTGGFIIGFDSDPPDIFDRQIEFIQELAIPTAMVGLLTALPNTKLHDRLVREGRLRSISSGNNLSSTTLNFRPVMPEHVIAKGYRRVLQTLYSPSRYFDRCLKLIGLLPKSSNTSSLRIRTGDLATAIRSVLRQSFSRYGPQYLRFLLRAVTRRPGQLVTIFTLVIQGHHYIAMTRRLFRSAAPSQTRDAGQRSTTRTYEQPIVAGTMD